MKWFRVYDEIIDDYRVLRFSYEFRWFFVGILAISSRQFIRGTLPDLKEISLGLRVTQAKAARVIQRFVDAGLVDRNPEDGSLYVHGWKNRQFQSDDVTARTAAAKERARERSRQDHPEQNGNVPLAGARDRVQRTENTKKRTSVSERNSDAEVKTKSAENTSRAHAHARTSDASTHAKPPLPPGLAAVPPEVIASDPVMQRIIAEDERNRRAADHAGGKPDKKPRKPSK